MRKSLTRPKTYGNPFETNVLVRFAHDRQRSFFVHELPPNCPIDHLRDRIREKRVPFDKWELYIHHPDSLSKKVVLQTGVFADYGIKSWDTVWVRKVRVCSQNRRSVFRACNDIAQGLKLRCFDCKPKPAPTTCPSPRPYGYLSNNGSLFSRESLDYGAEQKNYIL